MLTISDFLMTMQPRPASGNRFCGKIGGLFKSALLGSCAVVAATNANAQSVIYDDFNDPDETSPRSARTGEFYSIGGDTDIRQTEGAAFISFSAPRQTAFAVADFSAKNSEASALLRFDGSIDSGFIESGVTIRQQSDGSSYRALFRPESTRVRVVLRKTSGIRTETLGVRSFGRMIPQAGDGFYVKLKAIGAAPTTLFAKMWPEHAAEPSAWSIVVSDSDPGILTDGSVGIAATSSTNFSGRSAIQIDNFLATAATDDDPLLDRNSFAADLLQTIALRRTTNGASTQTFNFDPGVEDSATHIAVAGICSLLGRDAFGRTNIEFLDESGDVILSLLGCSALGVSDGESASSGSEFITPIPTGTASIRLRAEIFRSRNFDSPVEITGRLLGGTASE